ncbi:DUF6286 domain-containing protein [Streptomyces caniscabiei]|uniref:DUF6286 domain-containing protein n=1 Tax=Streptomyces caniscabiei TaxID=2746961 RepID=A0A927QGB1_9ACTN|nr:DUF6286 domain-containing protein [Streptomyces caniscabiei]MBD9726013.1 hypothetical protein [Streptomyces caniscabiei]MDX3507736.1 DUF6286 domain-containing protein [Streptomyces caniscabiei]MDX3717698.1 DUF6286 domain-containing protein [Streptomyces caniscabiei]WEO25442.1 DUF6286 domain-containing protein [Streptomyces caniscabiei]
MSAHTWRRPTGDSAPSSDPGPAVPSADNPPGPGADATEAGDGSRRSERRFWSARRIPAALVALLSAAATGLLLYDVVSVRAGRSAMRWRRRLAEELATRPLDDTWMIVGAAVAMALGLGLFLLAVTPGLRRLLPMRKPTGAPGTEEVRAGLDRRAAALVLRDRAMQVPGVQSARVAVGRRKVKALARAHFRDLEEVRTDLDATLGETVTSLRLARRPTLTVRVRRPKKD